MKKLTIILLIGLISVVLVMAAESSSSINWLSRSEADTLFCSIGGDCSINNLTVNNITIIGNTTTINTTTTVANSIDVGAGTTLTTAANLNIRPEFATGSGTYIDGQASMSNFPMPLTMTGKSIT